MALGAEEFEQWWPGVSRRLSRALTRRGAAAADVEDVVQETALRALAAAPPVASADELARWSFTVARRIEIDRARRRGRVELVSVELADARPVAVDTARAAEGRVALATAAEGLASLSEADRAAILSGVSGSAAVVDRRAAVRDAVRRHRARARLVAAVGKLVGVGVAASQGMKRVAARFRGARVGLALAAAGAILLLPSGRSPSSAALPPAPAAPAVEEPPLARSAAHAVAVAVAEAAAPVRPALAPAPAPAPVAAPPPQDPGGGGTGRLPGTPVTWFPSFTSSVADVHPGRAVDCMEGDPDVDCMKTAVRLKVGDL